MSALAWPLFWIWLGGAVPVTLLAGADRFEHGARDRAGGMPAWAWAISVVLWPLFAADCLVCLACGRIKL